jgi:hypothetical protein
VKKFALNNYITLFYLWLKHLVIIKTSLNIARKGRQGTNPGGHNFVFLNASINKKSISFSEVVISEAHNACFTCKRVPNAFVRCNLLLGVQSLIESAAFLLSYLNSKFADKYSPEFF